MNGIVGCRRCTYADAYGRGCKHGLMFPVLVFMTQQPCPNYQQKTLEQLNQQLEILENSKRNGTK